MMVVWGNQRFSAIRVYTVTVVRKIVNSMDMNIVSFSFHYSQFVSLL